MTPMLLKASSQKGAAIPSAPTMTPPSAGPIARLTLMPTLLAATADGKSGFGTSLATTDCHAGAVMAEPTVTTKLNTQQTARRDQMKPYQRSKRGRDDGDGRLADDQKAALIHNIRERTRRNCKQKHRQTVCDLYHRDDEGVGVEARHEPAGSDVVHPAADVRDDRRNPDYGERPMTKGLPAGATECGCAVVRGSFIGSLSAASTAIAHDYGINGSVPKSSLANCNSRRLTCRMIIR